MSTMAILSKEIFYRNIYNETPCSVLHLWSSNCVGALGLIAKNVLIGSLKFFGPIYTLKLILNWKKTNGKFFTNQILLGYLRTVAFGVTFSVLLFGSLCVFARIMKFAYFNVLHAGFVAGLSVLVESQENRTLDTLLFFNQVLEGIVNILIRGNHKNRSRFVETAIFMCISSGLMYLFKTQSTPTRFTHLWFHPGRSLSEKSNVTNIPETACNHKNPCFEYACMAAFKYFCMGYLLELIRNVLSRAGQLASKPGAIFDMLFSSKHILFGLFFGSYAFLYRKIICYFYKKDGKETPKHSLIAGFLAATTYYLKPNIHMPIIGFTTILQLLWARLRKKFKLPNNWPYNLMVFVVCNGILLHYRFLLEDYCPNYTKNMLSIVTNNIDTEINDNLWWLFRQTDELLANPKNLHT